MDELEGWRRMEKMDWGGSGDGWLVTAYVTDIYKTRTRSILSV